MDVTELLLPAGLGPEPWSSPRYRAIARVMDYWSFFFMLANNLAGIWILQVRVPSSPMAYRFLPSLLFVTCGILQQLASVLWPDAYYRHRHVIVVFARLLRMPWLLAVSQTVRSWAHNGELQEAVDTFASTRPTTSRVVSTLSFLLASSGTLHALTHTVAVPLPFVPQLVLQSACLAILLLLQSQPAALCLDLSPFRHEAAAACATLNQLLFLISACFGTFLDWRTLEAGCRQHSSVLLVMLVQLYFGLVLPLYFSYRVDQDICRHVRRHSQRPPTPAAGGPGAGAAQGRGARSTDAGGGCGGEGHRPALMLAGDALVLAYLVVVCWVVVVGTRPLLTRLAVPIEGLRAAAGAAVRGAVHA